MDAVTPVNGNTYFGVAAAKAKNGLDMETFLRLLTTQLANQNPLEPMNDRDFFAQMAQLGQVQGTDNMLNSLEATQAAGLIGKVVTGVRAGATAGDSSLVVGTVRALVNRNGEYYVQVQEANGGIAECTVKSISQVFDSGSDSISADLQRRLDAASLLDKVVSAPHPSLKGADGKPETLTGAVKAVSFENGSVLLSVVDRLGSTIKIRLQDLTGIGGA